MGVAVLDMTMKLITRELKKLDSEKGETRRERARNEGEGERKRKTERKKIAQIKLSKYSPKIH
jgi:hypothetical protein